jgi:hypothetical protein
MPLRMGSRRIEVPLDEKILKKAVKEYGKLLEEAEKNHHRICRVINLK